MDVLPESARRLFPGIPDKLDLERHGAFVIARLLEEGDSGDLAWLVDRPGSLSSADIDGSGTSA